MASTLPKKSEACIGVDVIPMLKQLKVVGDVSIQDVSAALWEVLCTGHYSIKPRFMLEKSTTELHFIPYIKVTNAARDRVMVYQRPARDDGEVRLDGMFSIGLGGHPESKALEYRDNVLDLFMAMIKSAIDEFKQELRVELMVQDESDNWDSTDITDTVLKNIAPVGFIYDPSDDVGLTHVAVLCEVVVSDEALFVANSPTEVRDPRWIDVRDVVNETRDGLENWTRLWNKHDCREVSHALSRQALNG